MSNNAIQRRIHSRQSAIKRKGVMNTATEEKTTYYCTAIAATGDSIGFYAEGFSADDAWDHASESDGVAYVTAVQRIA